MTAAIRDSLAQVVALPPLPDATAWMIQYTGGGFEYTGSDGIRCVAETYPVRQCFMHNAIADYRSENFDDATSTELFTSEQMREYARAAIEQHGPALLAVVEERDE